MKLTNEKGLHASIAAAIAADPYDDGGADVSVTGLIGPPRIRILAKRHKEKLVQDVSERVWALLGQAVHSVIERANTGPSTHLSEQRFHWEVSTPGGFVKLSGAVDDFDPASGTVTDWKVTSAWTIVFGDRTEDWERQLNCYAHLLRNAGHSVNALEVVAILRDWSAKDAREKPDYPQIQVVTVPLKLWPAEEATRYVEARCELHRAAEGLPDALLPLCSPEERWARPAKWAVMKPGGTRAIRLFDSHADARAASLAMPGTVLEERKGEDVRCKGYCSARSVCSYALAKYA